MAEEPIKRAPVEVAEDLIHTNGPRVKAAYGLDYYNGWCAGLRNYTQQLTSQGASE